MTEKQRTEYTRIGLALCKIGINNATAELIWRMQDLLASKGGKVTLMDTSRIESIVNKKYKKGK
jgi:hypothetical protein